MVNAFDRHRQLEKDFIIHLTKGELFPYSQPKVELETEKIVGVEALARWIHPKEGFVPPSVFIPMAEKNDIIAELDFLIAESAIRALKSWMHDGVVSKNFKMSFNISVKTLEELDVYDRINRLLECYGIPGENIQVEITESIFINNIDKVVHEMNHLKEALGISIALDDFTAGHASLKGLGNLGIDTLKFDRSLLQIVKANVDRGHRIYSTLVHLSDDMGYISVAEGIEDASESEFLKKEGVKYAQGFYFGKPMPAFLSISKVSPNKYVGVYTDLSLPKIREKEINIMKNYDTLTMLPNKKHFEEIVDYEIKNNSDYFITVVSFYIKNTSLIIDRFGMVVLENLFNLMRDKISEKLEYRDTLSRFSGSYFGLLLTCIKEQEEIERKIQEINSMTKEPLLIDGKEIYVECSFGIATYPNDGTSAGTLIKNSMLAQHQATLVYGKDYFFYSKGIESDIKKDMEIEVELRKAVKNKQFFLMYQPKVDSNSGEISGVEALIRWEHPSLGVVPPFKFIPIAEKIEIIGEITMWVVEEALRTIKKFKETGHELKVAINISPEDFKDQEIFDEIIKKASEQSRLIEIELTEGMLMESSQESIEKLFKLKEYGFHIAIDDFGTGYSSLNYLKKFPLDTLKIDRSFIKDYPLTDDGTIAKVISELAKTLNLRTVAEGVETSEQLEFMRKIGCTLIQGYYYSPPVKLEELLKLIRNGGFTIN